MVRLFLLSMIELLKVSDEIIAGVQFFYCRPVTRELHVSNFVRYTMSATNASIALFSGVKSLFLGWHGRASGAR